MESPSVPCLTPLPHPVTLRAYFPSRLAMSIVRIALLVIWLLALSAVVLPGTALMFTVGRWLFWALLGVHALECVVFFARLRKAPGSLAGHLFNTMLFGIVHVRTLPRA